jgi:hypothetical protein
MSWGQQACTDRIPDTWYPSHTLRVRTVIFPSMDLLRIHIPSFQGHLFRSSRHVRPNLPMDWVPASDGMKHTCIAIFFVLFLPLLCSSPKLLRRSGGWNWAELTWVMCRLVNWDEETWYAREGRKETGCGDLIMVTSTREKRESGSVGDFLLYCIMLYFLWTCYSSMEMELRHGMHLGIYSYTLLDDPLCLVTRAFYSVQSRW